MMGTLDAHATWWELRRALSVTLSPGARRDDPRFAAAAREHADILHAMARKLCRDDAEARDLVQDTYERALRAWPTLPTDANVRAWMITILHNRFIDRCRRAKFRDATEPFDEVEVAPEAPATLAPWQSISPEQLRDAVERLPEEFRQVYRLHAEGRSYDELATALGIPRNTVGTRLLRARKKLRELLEKAVTR
jgi:RNA polymerase sigma-70 factor, ECF subfamily